MRKSFKIGGGLLTAAVAYGIYSLEIDPLAATGFTAEYTCSDIFVTGRNASDTAYDVGQASAFFKLPTVDIDYENKTVTAALLGGYSQTAVYREKLGCTLASSVPVEKLKADYLKYPDIPERADIAPLAQAEEKSPALETILDHIFSQEAIDNKDRTRALLVIKDGKILAERYAEGFGPESKLLGWSMTKSVMNALAGIMVRKGELDIYADSILPAWQQDERKSITVDNLLRMNTGLYFNEIYSASSDVTKMIFTRPSTADYASAKLLEFKPGDDWKYSSGTSNILAKKLRVQGGKTPAGFYAFLEEELLQPLGMTNTIIQPDAEGDLIGSSFMYASARNWARFGLLYLNDGVWDGTRILPEGWVDYTRTVTPGAPGGVYGAHFWLNAGVKDDPAKRMYPTLPTDTYWASGVGSQKVVIIPSKNMVVVRLGVTTDGSWDTDGFISDMITVLKAEPSDAPRTAMAKAENPEMN